MGQDEASKITKAGNEWKKFMITSKIASSNKANRRHAPELEKVSIAKRRSSFSTIYQELGLTGDFWSSQEVYDMEKAFEAYDIDKQKALLKYFIANRDLDFIVSDKKNIEDAIMILFKKEHSITNTLVSRIYNETEITAEAREFFRAYAYAWAENFDKVQAEAYKDDSHAAGCLRVITIVCHQRKHCRWSFLTGYKYGV